MRLFDVQNHNLTFCILDAYQRSKSISDAISNKLRQQQHGNVPVNGNTDACHIDMSRLKYQFSPPSLSSINAHDQTIKKSVSEDQSNCAQINTNQAMYKDTEKNKVHFSNAGGPPEKEDIISLYGTPKEEIIPGVNTDGYGAEDEDELSHKGNNCIPIISLFGYMI